MNQGRGIGLRLGGLGSSAASSSGVSEPELAGLGAAHASSTNTKVAAGCNGRARWLMQSHILPPSLGQAYGCSRPSDGESHQAAHSHGIGIHLEGFGSSAASSSSVSEAVAVPVSGASDGDEDALSGMLSAERDSALDKTLNELGLIGGPVPMDHQLAGKV